MKINRVTIVAPILIGLLFGCARSPAPAEKPATTDFSGLWQVADSDYVRRPDVFAVESDYTAKAWANLQILKSLSDGEPADPAKFCTPGGMPHTVLTRARDYVFEIHQYPSELIFFAEYMDQTRVVHLDVKPIPESIAPSNQGYSTGHFEGSVLVVETSLLKARNPVDRMQRSDQARISERWSRRSDPKFGEVIDIDVTVTDPEVFRNPIKGRQMLKRAPPDAVRNEYGCTDALWNDYVAERLAKKTRVEKGAPR